MTQAALGTSAAASPDMVGKYERDEVCPSVDVAARLASALSISLDYLAGASDELGEGDPEAVRRVREIGALGEDERDRVYLVVDALLRDFQARGIYKR